MYSVSYCAAVYGITGCMIRVEADVSNGLPSFSLVGYVSSEVKEARERVLIGIKNAGYLLPPKKITVNLSPAHLRKDGTGYDLAIAVAVFTAFGYISQEFIQNIIFIGELTLEGKIKEVHGVLPMVYTAKEEGFLWAVVPKENVKEAGLVQGIEILPAESLGDLVRQLEKGKLTPGIKAGKDTHQNKTAAADFSEIKGQNTAKRAVEIAVAGRHNLLMIGPPGSGKTMIAQRIPGIMPDMTFEEQMEVSKIYSVAGFSTEEPLIRQRPFRNPHHTITAKALIGGGKNPKPGEISLANHGVLFLDELTEFQRGTIETLRQPLESGMVTISRTEGIYVYPAKVQLVAATNPCPCGRYPDRKKCTCTQGQIRRYLSKISGPILERMDLCAEMEPLGMEEVMFSNHAVSESSESIRKRVEEAQKIQRMRYRKEEFKYNTQMTPKILESYCNAAKEAEEYFRETFPVLEISARVYHKIWKVARTIADLEGKEQIEKKHIAEAICFRMPEKKYWGSDYDG